MSEMNKKVTKAYNFCREAHDKQKRKYTGEPYWCHPVEVMNLVEEAEGSDDMLCAALLHDVVEDTKYGVDDIREMFGNKVAELVYWLTDKSKPEDGNREVRKSIDREHISKAPKEAKTIKLADMISNAGSITDYDKDFAKVYMAEKKLLLPFLQEGNKMLFKRATRIVEEYYENNK